MGNVAVLAAEVVEVSLGVVSGLEVDIAGEELAAAAADSTNT